LETPPTRIVLRARNFDRGYDSEASDPYPDEEVKKIGEEVIMDSDDPDYNI
jgi:hypothetical protein